MRLFIAIELAADTRRSVVAAQLRLRSALSRGASHDATIRFVPPAQLHLTLVFLGEVAESAVPRLSDALRPAIPQPPYGLAFGGVGIFPTHGAPRVLWLGIHTGSHETRALQAAVVDRVSASGLTADDRPFAPHLTLARWRDGRPRHRRLIEALAAQESGSVQGGPIMQVSLVTLFHSQPGSDGVRHTPILQAPLVCH